MEYAAIATTEFKYSSWLYANRMSKNSEFYMNADLSPYIGNWIAICNNSIVSEGDDAKRVFSDAQSKYPGKEILLTKVPDGSKMIF